MTDPRYTRLATLLVNYSTTLKKGDRALLDVSDIPDEFTIELIRAVRAAGATPFVETRHSRVNREQLMGMTDAQASDLRDLEMFRMKKMQAEMQHIMESYESRMKAAGLEPERAPDGTPSTGLVKLLHQGLRKR